MPNLPSGKVSGKLARFGCDAIATASTVIKNIVADDENRACALLFIAAISSEFFGQAQPNVFRPLKRWQRPQICLNKDLQRLFKVRYAALQPEGISSG